MNHRTLFVTLFLTLLLALSAAAEETKSTYVRFKTNKGDFVIELYDETPLHEANFLSRVREGAYDGTTFHRVIRNFMAQAGGGLKGGRDPKGTYIDSLSHATVEAEILYPKLFHKRGAVAAARVGNDINPERRSDGLQFYIVMGQFYLEGELREFESEERPMPEEVKKAYMTEGGTPHLDGEYTVFGQIVSGMRTIEKICATETDETDKPRKEIYIKSAKVVSRP